MRRFRAVGGEQGADLATAWTFLEQVAVAAAECGNVELAEVRLPLELAVWLLTSLPRPVQHGWTLAFLDPLV